MMYQITHQTKQPKLIELLDDNYLLLEKFGKKNFGDMVSLH